MPDREHAPTENREGAGTAPFDPANIADARPADQPGAGAPAPVDEEIVAATAWNGASDDEMEKLGGEGAAHDPLGRRPQTP